MDRNPARPANESHRFPGHDARLSDLTYRIRSRRCECGSGKSYGDCCMGRDRQRSYARVSYTLAASVHPDQLTRCNIEDHLRLRAFGVFYRAGHQEHNLLVRFAHALAASAGPIHDECQVLNWHGHFCARPARTLRRASQ